MNRDIRKLVGIILGIVLIGVFVGVFGGTSSASNWFSAVSNGFKHILLWLKQIFNGFLPYWELDDWAICVSIFFVILFIASICGTVYSAKQKNKLWTGICSTFDILTLLGAVVSASNLK